MDHAGARPQAPASRPRRLTAHPTRRLPALVLASALLSLGLAACGESKEEKAKKTVCAARADINTRVQHLKGLTLSSKSIEEAKSDLTAIGDDVTKIKDALPDLSGSRRAEVEKATSEFANQAQTALSAAAGNLTPSNLKAQLKPAFEALATAYEKALAPINCS